MNDLLSSAWLVVLIRIAIGIVAGEIAIRYLSWWMTLYSSEEKFTATPIILGVSVCATALCGIELQYMVIRSLPQNVLHEDITEGHLLIAFFRLMLLGGALFLSYPVNMIYHRHSKDKAMTEMLVRIFLIAASFIAGVECATLYHCRLLAGWC